MRDVLENTEVREEFLKDSSFEYAQLKEPVLISKDKSIDENKLINRAKEKLEVEQCEEKLKFEVVEKDEKMVVFLRTLLRSNKNGKSVYDRVNVEGLNHPSFTIGPTALFTSELQKYEFEKANQEKVSNISE